VEVPTFEKIGKRVTAAVEGGDLIGKE